MRKGMKISIDGVIVAINDFGSYIADNFGSHTMMRYTFTDGNYGVYCIGVDGRMHTIANVNIKEFKDGV